jgi:hypothetical protein
VIVQINQTPIVNAVVNGTMVPGQKAAKTALWTFDQSPYSATPARDRRKPIRQAPSRITAESGKRKLATPVS